MTTLQDQLDEITANTRHLVQADRLAVGERAVEELLHSGIEEKILPVGALAPEFALKDCQRPAWCAVRICSALGPLVIKFFRGRWCPYCITELEAWRDLYGRFARARRPFRRHRPANCPPERLHGRPARTSLPGAARSRQCSAEKFGLVYTVPEYHRAYYLSILVNIPFVNGEKSWRLPMPATYVIVPQRPQSPLRRSACRLSRPPRTGRSAGSGACPSQPLSCGIQFAFRISQIPPN